MNEPKKKPRYVRWLRDLFLLLLVFAVIQWWQSRDLAHGPAPALAGPDLNYQPLALETGEEPVLVYFWATWCPICRLESGSVDSIAKDYRVITVATTSGDAQEVQAYLDEAGLSFPVMLDESGDLARRWGVNGVPASFIVDRQGLIDYAGKGYSTEWGLRARLWLAP